MHGVLKLRSVAAQNLLNYVFVNYKSKPYQKQTKSQSLERLQN